MTLTYTLGTGLCLCALAAGMDVLLRRIVDHPAEAFARAEAGRFASLAARRKPRILQADIQRWADHHDSATAFALLFDTNGNAVASSDLTHWEGVAPTAEAVRQWSGDGGIRRVSPTATGARVCMAWRRAPGAGCAVVGISQAGSQRLVNRVRALGLLGLSVSLLVGAMIAGRLMRGVVARMNGIRRTAERIASTGGLEGRVPLDTISDELRDLAEAFNGMLDRMGLLVGELEAVSDHIAHELRTPLTRIRGLLEPWLTEPAIQDAERTAIADAVEECDRLSAAASTMLQMARLRAGREDVARSDVDLNALVKRAGEGLDPVAEDKAVRIETNAVAALSAPGSPELLERVIANLMENAIRHTPAGGTVRVDLDATPATAVLTVTDTGPGIPKHELPHVFDRFHRGSYGGGSAGLGLALVKAIVEAHAGTVTAGNVRGGGARFQVTLPREVCGL